MMMTKRRFTRFLLDDHAFAALGSNFSRVGKIIDISIDGLAFEYLNDNIEAVEGVSRIKLVSSVSRPEMLELSCIIISDFSIRTADNGVKGLLPKNRCGVHFLSPSKDQQDQLECFIKDNLAGVASPA